MSLTNCRFYEEKYPEVESFVMVNVKQVRHQSPLSARLNFTDLNDLDRRDGCICKAAGVR